MIASEEITQRQRVLFKSVENSVRVLSLGQLSSRKNGETNGMCVPKLTVEQLL